MEVSPRPTRRVLTRCCHWRLKNSASQPEPWDPISLVAISCSDNLVGSRRWPSPEVGEGNAATRFHQSAWLPPVHKETSGPCVRIVKDGEVSPCRQTPFAALPSMRNLRLKYEEESMSEVDGATLIARSLKQQGIDHLFGVVGFPVTPIAAAA